MLRSYCKGLHDIQYFLSCMTLISSLWTEAVYVYFFPAWTYSKSVLDIFCSTYDAALISPLLQRDCACMHPTWKVLKGSKMWAGELRMGERELSGLRPTTTCCSRAISSPPSLLVRACKRLPLNARVIRFAGAIIDGAHMIQTQADALYHVCPSDDLNWLMEFCTKEE